MKIIVEDANVLLDLVHGGVLGTWLSIGYKNCTTHLVWNEVTDTGQKSLIQPFVEAGLIEHGAFLPSGECETRFARWR